MLLSSHILAEVEALCDRVSIVRAGRIVESGTLQPPTLEELFLRHYQTDGDRGGAKEAMSR